MTTTAVPTSPRAVAERLVDAVRRRDLDAFGADLAPGVVAHQPLAPAPAVGRDAVLAGEQAMYTAFSDVRVDVRALLADDRRCAMDIVLRAVNTGPLPSGAPATGREVVVEATWWLRVDDDGLVAELRDHFDTAALLAQLGPA